RCTSVTVTHLEQQASDAPVSAAASAPRGLTTKIVAALLIVLILGSALTIVTMSALATQRPRAMPFGVTGSSSVVTTAQSGKVGAYQVSFVNTLYSNENDVMNAINQGKIYGASIPGTTSDTLLTVPSKSFFAAFIITSLFDGTAKQLKRPLTVQQVKPLPAGKDPVGDVVGLLLLPLVVGGLLGAILVFKMTGNASDPWRAACLTGHWVIVAVVSRVFGGRCVGGS